MKRTLIALFLTATALVFGACNKHSWDEEIDGNPPTKKVFEEHGHDHDHKGHDEDGDSKGHEGEGSDKKAH